LDMQYVRAEFGVINLVGFKLEGKCFSN
jgi:hypothetical protein